MTRTVGPCAEGRFVDFHSHTTESDGTLHPAELVELARQIGLAALAITDHDTFGGYELAAPVAEKVGFDLVRGLELNTRLELRDGTRRSAHLLAYWPSRQPAESFGAWLNGEREDRRDRNRKLADALQARGVDITLAEVEERGRSLAGRTHFARLMVDKGYVSNYEEAFDRYLGEEAPTYVERESPTTEQAIRTVREGGGIPVIAHPIRLNISRDRELAVFGHLKDAGLLGLEIYHSEHPPELQAHYRQLAEQLALAPTGGSDFHGSVKPGVRLGSGWNHNVRTPVEFLDRMRAL